MEDFKKYLILYGNKAKEIYNIDKKINKAVSNGNKDLESELENKRYDILYNN